MQTAVEYHHEKSTELIHQYLDNKISTRELLTMHHNLFYPSKEMEKQQIIDSYQSGDGDAYNLEQTEIFAKQYYNETYINEGGDDKKINLVEIPQEQLEKERNPNYKYFDIDEPTSSQTEISDENAYTNGYLHGYNAAISELPKEISDKKPMRFHCVPKEISDEDIEKEAEFVYPISKEYKEKYKTIYDDFNTCWKEGAKWYREQLKKKQ